MTYKITGNIYKIPNIGYQLKLWDFDFSCIPGLIDNKKVSCEWSDKINIKPIENKYYDIHYFFNTLIMNGFLPDIIKDDIVPIEVKDFIDHIVPKKNPNYRNHKKNIHEKGRILIDHEYTTPNDLLINHSFFEIFRKKSK